jgi:hypothetical protein
LAPQFPTFSTVRREADIHVAPSATNQSMTAANQASPQSVS